MTPTTIHPFIRFWRLLRVEKGDLWTILVYTAIIGILSLAMPLATQALVNTIASGFLIQPIFTLTLMAGAALLGAGLLQIGQLGVVERLQQRVFAVTSLRMARSSCSSTSSFSLRSFCSPSGSAGTASGPASMSRRRSTRLPTGWKTSRDVAGA
jgi:ABC-type bacteriocin/lantibiotic exporter with double-glycine peptidase domain